MAQDKICALVPFRSLAKGKRRLTDAFSAQQRADFVAAMLQDTLIALNACSGLEDVILLSNDPAAAALARPLGAVCIAESSEANGLNSAVQLAAEQLAELYTGLLIVHGDLPLLNTAEIDQLLEAHRTLQAEGAGNASAAMTIVPDRHNSGSNCLLCSPVNSMTYHYGSGSLAKHLAFATQHDIQSQVLELAGAGLDIDEPVDVDVLRGHQKLQSAKHVAQFLS